MVKKYQFNYAAKNPLMYDKTSREQKARRLVKTLEDYFRERELKEMYLLDVGSSTGIIDNFLAQHFKKVVGTDIDKKAVKSAQKHFRKNNLKFKVGDAMKLEFRDNSFDVVTCLHIYEHVPNDNKLMREIYRVLKPGGVCYFAAGNRLWPLEFHHKLPFLSWLPQNLADIYVRLFKKADHYYESLRTYWGLKKLCSKFKIIEYTQTILRNPGKYGYNDSIKGTVRGFAWLLSPLAKYLSSTFFWILLKEE